VELSGLGPLGALLSCAMRTLAQITRTSSIVFFIRIASSQSQHSLACLKLSSIEQSQPGELLYRWPTSSMGRRMGIKKVRSCPGWVLGASQEKSLSVNQSVGKIIYL
jgi:hypothetical protein